MNNQRKMLAQRIESLQSARNAYAERCEKLACTLDSVDPAWGQEIRAMAPPCAGGLSFLAQDVRCYANSARAKRAKLIEHWQFVWDNTPNKHYEAEAELAALGVPVR